MLRWRIVNFSARLFLFGRLRKMDMSTGKKVTSLDEFLTKTKILLKMEKEAEYEQNRDLIECRSLDELCHAGVALKKLHLLDRRTGLGGRILAQFGSSNVSTALPNHKLSPGDVVNLCATGDHRTPLKSGVVSKVSEECITVAFDKNDDSNDSNKEDYFDWDSSVSRTFSLVQFVNEVTFQRLESTLEAMKKSSQYPGGHFVGLMFGEQPWPKSTLTASGSTVPFFNASLNNVQKEAVEFCLDERRPVCVVHGPPGTGKTTVVAEIIEQFMERNMKILACAPSNVAVDNLIEKLTNRINSRQEGKFCGVCEDFIVRLGHPARTHQNVQKHSLDLILKRREHAEILDDIRREIDDLRKEKDRRQANRRRKELKQELYEREKQAIRTVLRSAMVVCSTLTTASFDKGPLANLFKDKQANPMQNSGRDFDVVVIDECGQSTELACWAPILAVAGCRCILAGDHLQLPPTILSEKAAKEGFDRSLMARLNEEFQDMDKDFVRMLTRQYRMNEKIMMWPSENVYEKKLVADGSVQKHLLNDLPNVEPTEVTESALWLIDTSDCDMHEIATLDDESKANISEVGLTYLHVERLIRSGVPQESIAIISPYNLQVQLLRTYVGILFPKVHIRSIDGFQGQEKEAVILTIVRSNDRCEIGFLADRRRMNVAVTRAKRHLAIIGDCRTVSKDPFLRSLMEYMKANGVTKSALEYEEFNDTIPFSISLDGLALAPSVSSVSKTSASPAGQPTAEKKQKSKISTGPKKQNVQSKSEVSKDIETDSNLNPSDSSITSKWQDDLTTKINNFQHDDSRHRLDFPCGLLPHQRAFVHEMAENLNLVHYSRGEKPNRFIVIEKRPDSSLAPQQSEKIEVHQETPDQSNSADAPLNERLSSTGAVQKNTSALQPHPKPKKEKPKKVLAGALVAKMDDDQVMDSFAKEQSRCQFAKCKEPIALLGEKCKFCIQIFCLKHALPEVHGCGEAAKRHARLEVEKVQSGIRPSQQQKPDQRGRLQSKLQEKLKTMEDERSGKRPSNK